MTDTLPDIIAKDLTVLFCGINPGISAAVAGHHFVVRSNRFWRTIYLAGFTTKEISPLEDHTILDYGFGLTTVVRRATARADQLSSKEFKVAAAPFERKIKHYAPRFVAFLGKAAYAGLSDQREVAWGRQAGRMEGAIAWVLPNPSGRNRAFTLDGLVEAYRELYRQTLDVTGKQSPEQAA